MKKLITSVPFPWLTVNHCWIPSNFQSCNKRWQLNVSAISTLLLIPSSPKLGNIVKTDHFLSRRLITKKGGENFSFICMPDGPKFIPVF